MSSELLTGAVGLFGAALGAAGAVWAGAVTARSQRQQMRDQLEAAQKRWELDNKRDVYMQLLRHASFWQSSSWEFFDGLYHGVSRAEKAEMQRRKHGHWQEFAATSRTAMVFTADTDVQTATHRLQDALLALDRASEEWYRGNGRGGRDNRAEAFRTRSRECEVATASLAAKIEAALSLSTATAQSAVPNSS